MGFSITVDQDETVKEAIAQIAEEEEPHRELLQRVRDRLFHGADALMKVFGPKIGDKKLTSLEAKA